MVNLQTAGGDGASLSVAPRPKLKLFKAWSLVFRQPNGGGIATVEVVVMSKARWERAWRDRRPHMRALEAGPLIIGIGLSL